MSGRSVSNAARIAQATVAAFAGAPATLRHAMATAATAATTPLARSRVAPRGMEHDARVPPTPRAAPTRCRRDARVVVGARAARARRRARDGGVVESVVEISRGDHRDGGASSVVWLRWRILDVASIRPAPPRAIGRAYPRGGAW